MSKPEAIDVMSLRRQEEETFSLTLRVLPQENLQTVVNKSCIFVLLMSREKIERWVMKLLFIPAIT